MHKYINEQDAIETDQLVNKLKESDHFYIYDTDKNSQEESQAQEHLLALGRGYAQETENLCCEE